MSNMIEGKTKSLESFMNNKLVKITTKNSLSANDGELMKTLKVAEYKTAQTCDVFELLAKKGIPVAYLEREDLRTFFAKKCKMIPIECVMRRRPYGSYLKRHPQVSSSSSSMTEQIFNPLLIEFFHKYTVVMPCTVHKNQHAINTETRLIPEDKAREYFMSEEGKGWTHEVYTDPLIEMNDNGKSWSLYPAKEVAKTDLSTFKPEPLLHIHPMLGIGEVNEMKKIMNEVFTTLEDAWRKFDVHLIDLKIEFGRCMDTSELVVADVIDNDSWRLWPQGNPKKQLDKQSFRESEPAVDVVEKYKIVSEYTKKWAKSESS